MMMSLLGLLIPFLRIGIASRRDALCFAIQDKNIHQKDTSKNWTRVNVTGRFSAVRMAFEDMLLKMEDANHMQQRIFGTDQHAMVWIEQQIWRIYVQPTLCSLAP